MGCSYAKLLTGGMIPLAVTLATPEVFTAFEGDSKLDALLHGHSYTAHAVGCQVATTSLELYKVGPLAPLSPGSTSVSPPTARVCLLEGLGIVNQPGKTVQHNQSL